MDLYEAIKVRKDSLQKSSSPLILLLDIDDTLIDCRFRKLKVFLDFVQEEEVRSEFPQACEALSRLHLEQIQYRISDNLKQASIDDRAFGDRLFQYWLARYFTYPYLIEDQAFPGAVRFTKHCYEQGLALVYLTGRDIPGMGQGTFEAMKKLGFPTEGPRIHFLLKPDPKVPDLAFKQGALEEVAALGPVLAAFENELSNLNAMALRFPDAAMYWRKTLFSPDPPEPHPRVEVLAHFPNSLSEKSKALKS